MTPMASAAPPDVVASAVAAVAKLGDEVVMGRYQVAVERMNPLWKERTAKRMGGMEELEKQLAGVAAADGAAGDQHDFLQAPGAAAVL